MPNHFPKGYPSRTGIDIEAESIDIIVNFSADLEQSANNNCNLLSILTRLSHLNQELEMLIGTSD